MSIETNETNETKEPETKTLDDLSWIRCYFDSDIDEIVDVLMREMKLYDRERGPDDDDNGYYEAFETLSGAEKKVVKALYSAILHTFTFCGLWERNKEVYPALDCAEFAFMHLFPRWNSYSSFYIPVKRVVDYWKENWDKMNLEAERRKKKEEYWNGEA